MFSDVKVFVKSLWSIDFSAAFFNTSFNLSAVYNPLPLFILFLIFYLSLDKSLDVANFNALDNFSY